LKKGLLQRLISLATSDKLVHFVCFIVLCSGFQKLRKPLFMAPKLGMALHLSLTRHVTACIELTIENAHTLT